MTTITKHLALNILNYLSSIDLSTANVKTAYWISKNLRKLAPIGEEFEKLKQEITSTEVFKKYLQELEAAPEELKAQIQEKYKEVISEGDAELKALLDTEIEVPTWHLIPIDSIDGIDGKHIPVLFDMIDK